MVKTIAVSKTTYAELVKVKDELNTSSMDEALNKLMVNYKNLLKQLSIRGLFLLNKNEKKITLKQLLDDRGKFGWPRTFY